MTHNADAGAGTVQVHRVAATAVLLRDTDRGPEVLMLERPSDRGSFAGAWVFPGGSVDAADGLPGAPGAQAAPGEEEAARRAAVREVYEESALELQEGSLALVSCWTPPAAVPRRFRTWFYYASAPEGEIALSPAESVGYRWIHPASALQLHKEEHLQLVAPTWVTLHSLIDAASVDEVLAGARGAVPQEYATHLYTPEQGRILLWQGDVAYNDEDLFDSVGPRHRLDTRGRPWVYEHSRN
ncbi:NUDIX hydrolase [Rathayibacter soli]|uniref:NUDIX hydrolase n=1 Tax=Rathayibacter soli TaxID=3144168 RepID=UPI0027E48000|nr:NUDIX hydrolase [Glaciibacter superstes]